jgi:hypothetical protein
MFCNQCGTAISDLAKYCHRCGVEQPTLATAAAAQASPSQAATVLTPTPLNNSVTQSANAANPFHKSYLFGKVYSAIQIAIGIVLFGFGFREPNLLLMVIGIVSVLFGYGLWEKFQWALYVLIAGTALAWVVCIVQVVAVGIYPQIIAPTVWPTVALYYCWKRRDEFR